jgi:hypothetical protein
MTLLQKINKLNWFDFLNNLKSILKDLMNSGGGGGIESLSGDFVDNTDPLNPVLDRGYKVYTALLSQSGTDAPTAIVLEDELNVLLEPFYEDYPGEYGFTIDGGFPENKTFIPGFGRKYEDGAITWKPIIKYVSDTPLIKGYYTVYYSEGYIYTYFIDHLGNRVDLATFGEIIGSTEIPIEIRVYN